LSEDRDDAELVDAAGVTCPYCGERVELLVDVGGGPTQEYVEDCEVCCRPWSVVVRLDADGYATVTVTRLEDD